MTTFVKSILFLFIAEALMFSSGSALACHGTSSLDTETDQTTTAMETAVLHFQITEERFAAFRDVASYRKSRRLNVLPGFPEDPNLDGSVADLAGDAGTRERLGRAGLSPRDYVLTGWALITAHDPGDWGLTDRRMTGEMRRNIRFVQEHAPSVDALLQGE